MGWRVLSFALGVVAGVAGLYCYIAGICPPYRWTRAR